jgi:hypothetical protein
MVQIHPLSLEEFERRNMSTVMYCFRIKKEELWPFCDNLRAFYKENSLISFLIKIAGKQKFNNNKETISKTLEAIKNDKYHVDLQLFEENKSTWLFRVLEYGYLFMNSYTQFDQIKPVFYDDRSDVPEDQEANLSIAEQIDAFAEVKQYFIVPIIDEDYLYNYWFELREKKVKALKWNMKTR